MVLFTTLVIILGLILIGLFTVCSVGFAAVLIPVLDVIVCIAIIVLLVKLAKKLFKK